LSLIFTKYAAALKPGAPFVFTYHHNDLTAYAPVVVSVLDAGMVCTASLPAPAEMEASLHIAKTGSSILDSIFVCRRVDAHPKLTEGGPKELEAQVLTDCLAMRKGGVHVTKGDAFCLALGHVARLAISQAVSAWNRELPMSAKLVASERLLRSLAVDINLAEVPDRIVVQLKADQPQPEQAPFDFVLA
jgi:hypothetical protein